MQNQQTQNALSKFKIETRSGEIITLDKKTVEQYLTNGVELTTSEYTMFFQLCKVYKANPFLKEAYPIKYGSSPATIVLDYKVLQQMADDNPHYRGMATGVLVVDKNGNEKERKGSYVLPSETLIAGWCTVFRDDRECNKVYVMFEEFKQINKKTGELNSNWSGKPVFMITKVAKAQALREAFPNMFGSNVYSKEEAEMFTTDNNNQNAVNRDFINASVEETQKQVNENTATEEMPSFDDMNNVVDVYD
nr:MAG TPA: RecT protein [Caudoviricetes sp.]